MPDNIYSPTLSGLKAFVAVAQKNHFGSAATMLGVSQPSLSQALAALETGLGVQLVERSTRRVFLTAEGRELLPRAQRAIDAVDDFIAAAQGAADPSTGALQLGLIPTIAPYVLPTVLAGVSERMPQLTLRVVEDQTQRLLESLRIGEIDAAILALPADASGMVEIPIYDEDFVLALPPGHALTGRTQVHPDALAQLPLLLLDEGHCLRDQALEVCALAGISPDLGHTRAASLSTAVQCVTGGLGVTLIPRTAVTVEKRGGLGLAEFSEPRPGRRIGLVYRASRGSDEFYRTLAAMIGEVVAATGVVDRIELSGEDLDLP